MAQIVFGKLLDIQEDYVFKDRRSMMKDAFHRKWACGIDYDRNLGVSAIVLSGGYTDDNDYGKTIIYTGSGGNFDGKQIADQSLKNPANAAFLINKANAIPIRVIRGKNHISDFSPIEGYQYAGLYYVMDSYVTKGIHGFEVCKFTLIHENAFNIEKEKFQELYSNNYEETKRKMSYVNRIIRNTKFSESIKNKYKNKCQICSIAIETKDNLYSEAAHIRPLGSPHNGYDSIDNLLCLCPNHHVMFDSGSISLNDNFELIGKIDSKKINLNHNINISNIQYHRKYHQFEY